MKKSRPTGSSPPSPTHPRPCRCEYRRWTEGDRKVEPTDRFRPPHWRSIGYEPALRLRRGQLLCRDGPRLASPTRQANNGRAAGAWAGKSRLGVVMCLCCKAVSSQRSSQEALCWASESHKSRTRVALESFGHDQFCLPRWGLLGMRNRGQQEVLLRVQHAPRPCRCEYRRWTEGDRKVEPTDRFRPPHWRSIGYEHV